VQSENPLSVISQLHYWDKFLQGTQGFDSQYEKGKPFLEKFLGKLLDQLWQSAIISNLSIKPVVPPFLNSNGNFI